VITSRSATLVAYRAVSDVAGKGAFFLITIAAARRLTGEAFGVFSLASTIGWIAAVVTDFGIQLHLARSVAQHPADASRLLGAWLRVRLWTAAVALSLIGGILAATGSAGQYATAILLLAGVYVTNGVIEFYYYFYRGLSRSDIESTLTLCQRGATLALALVALWWRPTLDALAIAMLLPAAAALVYSAWRASLLGRAAAHGGLAPPAASIEPSLVWSEVWPIGTGIVLSALYFRSDVFLVQWWSGTTAVGLYSSVFRLVEALRLFPAAAIAVALPSLCRATNLRPAVQLSTALTGFAAATAAALWVAAGWLVPLLYGEPYAPAAPVFRVLLLAFPLMSLNYALTHQLIGWNGHRTYAALCGAALFVNISLNVKLIPAFSILGAAWSTVLTEIVITAGSVAALSMGRRTTARLAVLGEW
jgi:O-antigen/teichoic acid export membrane protein